MNRDLFEALVDCSAKLQQACKTAVEHERHDLAARLRRAGIEVASAIAAMAPDRSVTS